MLLRKSLSRERRRGSSVVKPKFATRKEALAQVAVRRAWISRCRGTIGGTHQESAATSSTSRRQARIATRAGAHVPLFFKDCAHTAGYTRQGPRRKGGDPHPSPAYPSDAHLTPASGPPPQPHARTPQPEATEAPLRLSNPRSVGPPLPHARTPRLKLQRRPSGSPTLHDHPGPYRHFQPSDQSTTGGTSPTLTNQLSLNAPIASLAQITNREGQV